MARVIGVCFTVNNYTEEQVLKIKGMIGKCNVFYVCFGREVAPETGTPHLQGYLQIRAARVQYDRLKAAMGGNGHFTGAKGSDQQNYDYCSKDGDFWEAGDRAECAGQSKGKRSDLDEVKSAIAEGQSYEEICETHFSTAAKYGRFIQERVNAQQEKTGRASLLSDYEDVSWKQWQQDVLDVIDGTPDRRQILWVWDQTGNVGKSYLAKYLALFHNALVIENGKKVDMAYIFAKMSPTPPVVVFDLSRTVAPTEGKDYLAGTYSLCENLKNGMLTTTKYDSRVMTFPVPHVIVFANFTPDFTKWSRDRYNILQIDGPTYTPPQSPRA